MNISNFKRGQFITRTQGAIGKDDYSFIGDKLTLLAVANGSVYILDSEGDRIEPMELVCWSEGWELYVEVEDLELDEIGVPQNEDKDLLDDFKAYVKKLHDSQNYEVLAELRDSLNSVSKSK